MLGNVLTEQCRFMVDGNQFDLCRIFQRNGGIWTFTDERSTPPSTTTHQYKISFGGPLPKNESLANDEQCPDGTWVCMTKTNRHPKYDNKPMVIETIPVAGELSPQHCDHIIQSGNYYPGLNVTAQMVKWGERHDPVLSIHMLGGYYVDRRQSLTIFFDCHKDAEKPSLHHFEGGWEGNHMLSLRSRSSCPQAAGDPPADEVGDDELISLPSKDRAIHKIWMIILSSVCAILLVAYCIHSPPKRFRKRFQEYLKKHPSLLRFRVGENVLVRWAYEDLALDESEEDVMVNATNDNYLGDDEQIPLKPSPRKPLIASYGAAK
ncbi:hypothetical protein NM688_g6149 [Phlebia brevispora]|uniref:Uncharacterized protein n=1 Tax=Phlebia brevispora TaxID=194682 RepID=A0ACC1SJC5_9APHY|nr:hypothetical protein NM688_g6149 [Phlebia brevispora]